MFFIRLIFRYLGFVVECDGGEGEICGEVWYVIVEGR